MPTRALCTDNIVPFRTRQEKKRKYSCKAVPARIPTEIGVYAYGVDDFGKFLKSKLKRERTSIGKAAHVAGISKTSMARLLRLQEPGRLQPDTITGLRKLVGDGVLRWFPAEDGDDFSESDRISVRLGSDRPFSPVDRHTGMEGETAMTPNDQDSVRHLNSRVLRLSIENERLMEELAKTKAELDRAKRHGLHNQGGNHEHGRDGHK